MLSNIDTLCHVTGKNVVFVVFGRFGIDAGAYTLPYVARRAQDKAVLRPNLAAVRGVAAGLIPGVEAAGLAEEVVSLRG